MANSARLRQLGLPDFIPNGLRIAANSKDNNKTNERNREDADYDPLHDDTDEQDLCDDDIAKVMILASYGFDLHDGADVGAQPVGVNQMTNEGGEVPWNRGTNMGHGLNRLNRSHRAKLPIVIPEGQIRPLVPLIAAKYATEINIAVRNHMPVLTHWKEYKGRAEIEEFLGILRAKFNIDTNDAVVKNGCLEMMRNAMICQKNKDNRGNVLLHQTTGSCSYAVFVENLEDENEDENTERNAFNLFKMCHFSKKKDGYTPAVQSAITQMETQLAAQPTQGEQPKSAVQVVANTKRPRMSAQLEAEKRENAKFRLIVSNQREQMEGLSKQVQETELTRIRDKEEMSKKQAELEAKLELVLGQHGLR
ncbi:hypothetical protein PAHAL_7G097400 [Panicum hallii]|uniref:Uncharacterized protein n=1 Tax=Panicum hallii TaxID=206008 RepID=A0A2T8IBN0_9POAL|nr:hypothetical protein PAHAL_7G097400 [Panicum hallii]